MAVQDATRLADGFLSLEGGCDSAFAPSIIQQNQLSWMVNCTVRGGFPQPRPPWVKHDLDFGGDSILQDASTSLLFQGAGSYHNDDGDTFLALSVGGRVFTVNLTGKFKVEEITPKKTYTATTVARVSGVATITLSEAHSVLIGGIIRVSGLSESALNGEFTVTDVSSLTVSFASAGADIASTSDSGVVTAYDTNMAREPHAWFQQAENWLIVQNSINRPVLFDGATSRRAGDKEVPVGSAMAYGKGRLWVAQGNLYYGGDLVWSDPSLGRDSVVKFTENDFLAEGGAFAVPGGNITGMAFGANMDTSLGDGDLLVFTASSAFAFSAPIDRTVWKNLDYPIQRFALLNYGSQNHESIVAVNGDLFFRSQDGIRSFIYARRDFENWGNTSIGRNVNRAVNYDTMQWLYAASSVNFDNRVLMTVSPRRDNTLGIYHKGVVAFDFDHVGGFGAKIPAAWEGVWTGLDILRIITARVNTIDRCFAFVRGADRKIELWELLRSGVSDRSGTTEIPIQWSVETRSYTFQTPAERKKLMGAELWFDRMLGDVEMTTSFRPNQSECWTPWAKYVDCAKYKACDETEDCQDGYPYYPSPLTHQKIRYFRAQSRSRIGLPQPPDIADPQTGGMVREGFEFQVRIETKGSVRLKRLALIASRIPEAPFGDISKTECVTQAPQECAGACTEMVCCDPDDFSYSIQ